MTTAIRGQLQLSGGKLTVPFWTLVPDATDEAAVLYAAFWSALNRGESQAGEFRRISKDGHEVWLRAAYTPITDPAGRVFKVEKYATDVTQEKLLLADYVGQIAAIGRTQAVIEFTTTGEILNANKVFLSAMGYSLDEVLGEHHRMFVSPDEAASPAYTAFWAALARGEAQAGEFRRQGRDGRKVGIRATYCAEQICTCSHG